MKKYVITMNMPSTNGKPVHQITCTHPAPSLDHLLDEISNCDFLKVEEYYRDASDSTLWTRSGPILLNTMLVGKIRSVSDNVTLRG